ncbi:putative integral membrane protein [Corynespora cassiicola Philippines]|uniref:Putative integral membrane protein n=1 Tax=Corynespora cassiicola Philippines TaxID=1448308 RepID=A0A2T2NH65_CORCC|nr:putative integral membrane protein [Corynespora cassiicola Philippines]
MTGIRALHSALKTSTKPLKPICGNMATHLSLSPTPTPTFTPALKPPPGITPEPDNPASLAHVTDISIGVCIPLISIFFGLRTYVRGYLKRIWLFEDYLVTVSAIGSIAYCGIVRATMANHGGEHGWDITPGEAHQAAYWFNTAAVIYGVMICVTKISILVLYRRVFSPVRWSRFDISIITLIIAMALFYGITTFLKIFQCYPRQKIWNNSVHGKCIEMSWILNMSGGFNTVTDYMILLLPIHAVKKLQMDQLKKIFVVLAFTFGLWQVPSSFLITDGPKDASCCFHEIELTLTTPSAPIFATIGLAARIKNSGNLDKSWKQPEILLWGMAELSSCNLCVSFPEITTLFRKRRHVFGPRRPTASVLKALSDSHSNRKQSADPYLPKSLMSNTLGAGGEGSYIELDNRS